MIETDVIVVGAGPVGEVLLELLAAHGLTAVGLEQARELWPKPRAVHFDGETLRTFQSIGLGRTVADATAPMRNYRMTNEAGETLLAFPTGGPGPEGWLDDVMFHQPDVDRVLRNAIAGQSQVQLLLGHQVIDLTQTPDHVTAVTRDADGDGHEFRARYLVGADGASSFVRRRLGFQYEELGPNNPWLVVDGIYSETPPISDSMLFFGKHSRPRLWAELPGLRRRMEFKVLPGDDLDEIVTPEWIESATDGAVSRKNFTIERTAVYTFRSCLAQRWRDGRVFLAGDAAHLAPPLFGQGLCSGIRDAANLSWKLALVLRGAAPSLLDSYESERKPHARAWIEQATQMSEIIQTTDPEVAKQRDAFVQAHPEAGVAAIPTLGSGLHVGEQGGSRAIQPTIPGERAFDDQVGQRFLLAATRAMLESVPPGGLETLRRGLGCEVLDDRAPGVAELLAAAGADAAVVRPDRYIYGTATDPEEFSRVLEPLLAIAADVAGAVPA